METLRRLLRQVSEGVSAAVQLGLFTRMARAPGQVAAGGGVCSGGGGPPRPARSPQGCGSGEQGTEPEHTRSPDDRTRLPRAPDIAEQSRLEVELDPRAAAEPAAEAGERIGEPHLPAVFRSQRSVGAVDGAELREEARARLVPLAADAAARIRGRDSRAWGTAKALDLAGLAARGHVEPTARR